MMKNRTLEALEKEEERSQQREEIPVGLQQAIKRTQDAIKKAFNQSEIRKGTKLKLTFGA
jgi:fructose-specific phosphotransferase system component IIB